MELVTRLQVQPLKNPETEFVGLGTGETPAHRDRLADEIPPGILLSGSWPRKSENHRFPRPCPRHIGLECRERFHPCRNPYILWAKIEDLPQ